MDEFQTTVVRFTLTPQMAADMAREIQQAEAEAKSRITGVDAGVVRWITGATGDAAMAGRSTWRSPLFQLVFGCSLGVAAAATLILAVKSPDSASRFGAFACGLGAASAGVIWQWNKDRKAALLGAGGPATGDSDSNAEYGEVEFTLSDAGARWESCGRAWEWGWSCIFRIDDVPSYVVIRDRNGDALPLPKSALGPDGGAELLARSRAALASMGFDQTSRIRAYLASHDIGCPTCGYSLHNGAGDRCPECGLELSYEWFPIPGAPWMPVDG